MSALSIQVPYQIFADSDGTPLDNGYVWIGTTNLDPRTNPVNVYFDAALTQVAPNPLRTVNGYVYNAGSPAQLYIDGANFSLRVEDKKSVLVYSFPAGSGISPNASGITYAPAGTGAVATTVQGKLRESVSVKDFGAVGDGVTDDTLAIQAALTYAGTIGRGIIVSVPPSIGPYIFTSLSVPSDVAFYGCGGTLKLKNNTCTNASTTYYLICNLTGVNVTYENLIIDGNRATNNLFLVADAITATGYGAVVRGCRITNTPDSGIMFSNTRGGICEGNIIDTGGDLGIYVNGAEGGSDNNTMLVTGNVISNFPYGGIGVKRSPEHTIVSNNIITTCGNGITVEDFGVGAGGAPDHLLITGNAMRNIGFPYRSQAPAEIGIALNFCTNVVVTNNKIQNVSGTGIGLSGTTDSLIQDNHLVGYSASPAASGNAGFYCDVRSSVTPTRNNISGNIATGFSSYGAYFLAITDSSINNNIFKSSDTALRVNSPCDNNTISHNRLDGALGDTAIYAGADANILQYNYQKNAATEWQKAGHIRSTSVSTPVANIVPNFPGQLCWITTAGPKIFMSYGITNTEWLQIG